MKMNKINNVDDICIKCLENRVCKHSTNGDKVFYRNICRECFKKSCRDNYDNSKKRKYYLKNREDILEQKRQYMKKRYYDPSENIFRLKITLRSMIRCSLLRKNYIKNKKRTKDVIGCEISFFEKYLESKFEPWMTWDNYGKYDGELNYGWDIDHVIPLASAETEEDIIKLNHYTNLQPLCSKINRDIKKDNYE